MRRTTWHFRSCRVLSLEPSIPATALPSLNSSNQKCPIPIPYSNETRAATASVLQPSGHTAERGGQHVVPGEGTDDEQHQDGNQSAWDLLESSIPPPRSWISSTSSTSRWKPTPQIMDLLDIVHTAAKILVGGCQVARLPR
ncbi:unnamed protein product [Musa hybrid cultivar]